MRYSPDQVITFHWLYDVWHSQHLCAERSLLYYGGALHEWLFLSYSCKMKILFCPWIVQVWKGTLNDMDVAIKVFTASQQAYFVNERDIYLLPHMDHESVVTFFGAEERVTPEGNVQYLLVMSYVPQGTLTGECLCVCVCVMLHIIKVWAQVFVMFIILTELWPNDYYLNRKQMIYISTYIMQL